MEASPPDSTETPDLVVNVSHFKKVWISNLNFAGKQVKVLPSGGCSSEPETKRDRNFESQTACDCFSSPSICSGVLSRLGGDFVANTFSCQVDLQAKPSWLEELSRKQANRRSGVFPEKQPPPVKPAEQEQAFRRSGGSVQEEEVWASGCPYPIVIL